jgi:putative ABC transport system permease protein
MFFFRLKLFIRSIIANKSVFFINLSGLSIGMACSMLIYIWVQDELSYESIHENRAQIYKVIRGDSPVVSVPLAPTAPSEIPEVELASRYRPISSYLLQYDDNILSNKRSVTVDSSFFDIFSFQIIAGDPVKGFSDPYSIVLSESVARNLFEEENPVGKTVLFNKKHNLTVRAVIEDKPEYTHIYYDVFIPFEFLEIIWGVDMNNWQDHSQKSFVMLYAGSDPGLVSKKITDMVKVHDPEEIREHHLQNLSDVRHYKTSGEPGNILFIYLFSVVAFIILLIAGFNYINLTTARGSIRAHEIGVQKVLGAKRSSLIVQYLTESSILAILSLGVAFLLVELILPLMNSFLNKHIEISQFITLQLFAGIIGIVLLIGFFAGFYPAIVLSSYIPIRVLKGKLHKASGRRGSLRKTVVFSQFTITAILMFGTIIIFKQLQFINSYDLGYDRENIVTFETNGNMLVQLYSGIEEFINNPDIVSFSISNTLPGNVESTWGGVSWEGKITDDDPAFEILMVDYNFIEVYGIEIADGRYFSRDFPSDRSGAYVINESAAKLMGFVNESAVGKNLKMQSYVQGEGEIIGVVKDFHSDTIHNPIQPLIFIFYPYVNDTFSIRILDGKLSEGIDFLERYWDTRIPEYVFKYSFFDQELEKRYLTEKRLGAILGSASGLAVFIACMGLFGLASFVAERRTREIGIRKVFGATVSNIIRLITFEYFIVILVANLIAWPIGWLVLREWLNQFAYKTSFDWWLFPLITIVSLTIAILTVASLSFRKAMLNPIDTLKTE